MKIEIEFDVSCNVCGKPLETHLFPAEILIDPCENCLQVKYDEGEEAE
jgi:hypothetical protein